MRIAIRAHDLGVRGEGAITERLRICGVHALQLVCYKSFSDIPYAPGGITPARAGEIGSAFKRDGVDLALLGAYFNPIHPDEAKRALGEAVFCDYLRAAGRLGCTAVGSETGSANGDRWTYHPENRTEASLSRVVETFTRLSDTASAYGMRVGIEGAAGHVCYDVQTLQKAVQRINRTNLLVIFDLFNFLDAGNCRDYLGILEAGLRAFPDRILCFHVKDCILTDGAPKQCPVGKGDLDFTRILAAIRRFDPDATLVLEGTTGDDLPPAVEFIKSKWGLTA